VQRKVPGFNWRERRKELIIDLGCWTRKASLW